MSEMTLGDLRRAAQVDTPDLGPAGICATARILTAEGQRRGYTGDIAAANPACHRQGKGLEG